MKAKIVFLLSAFFVSAPLFAQDHTPFVPPNDNPPYQPPPETPKPHVSDVAQPTQPTMAGQTNAAPDDETDPAKVADFQKRFLSGYQLEKDGKLSDALAIYEGILAEQPKAKGSLLHAGVVSFKLGNLDKADEYLERLSSIVSDEELERLHEQKPDEFPDVLEQLIQINQARKHDVKVELLIQRFTNLQKSGKLPGLSKRLWFDRELIHSNEQDIVISQFFDYTFDPNTVWMVRVYDPAGDLKRRLLLNYDAEATKALRAKDAKYANTQVFTWFEHVIKDGQVKEIDAYLQIFALPDYEKFRSAMLVILANPPKPIYSAPVAAPPAPQQ